MTLAAQKADGNCWKIFFFSVTAFSKVSPVQSLSAGHPAQGIEIPAQQTVHDFLHGRDVVDQP
jgi:hypothetical protein